MPLVLPDPELLAAYERRTGSRLGWAYEVKDGVAPNAMDVLADDGDIETDDAEMSIYFPFASSQSRDRVGDFLEVTGIETGNHERNPLAFLDHGKWLKWPIGLDQDKAKRYTVKINPERGLAFARVFLTPIVPEIAQVYEFYRKGVLRSGSIGYRTIREEPIGPDREQGLPRGKHLISTELLETSPVFLPCSQDAVLRMYGERWDGKSLCDSFRKILDPVKPRKKPWYAPEAHGGVVLTVEVREKNMAGAKNTAKGKAVKTAPTPSPAMSTTDATGGGALVPPPKEKGSKDVAETPQYDDTTPEQDDSVIKVSPNAQRMQDVHHILQAWKELGDAIHTKIDEDPQLLDHPDIKDHLENYVKPRVQKLQAGADKLQGAVAAKLAKTHPDHELPDYGDGGGKAIEDEEGEDDKDELDEEETEDADNADATNEDDIDGDGKGVETGPTGEDADEHKDENEDEPESAKKPGAVGPGKKHAKVNWHSPMLRAGNKGGVSGSGKKRLNMSQKAAIEEVREHLKACAEDPGTPKMHKSAHMHFHAKLGDMFEQGKDEEGDPAMSSDATMDGEKMMKLFTGFDELLTKKIEQQDKLLKRVQTA